ncbi:hypothetical protein [Streptomyces sp. KR55]
MILACVRMTVGNKATSRKGGYVLGHELLITAAIGAGVLPG